MLHWFPGTHSVWYFALKSCRPLSKLLSAAPSDLFKINCRTVKLKTALFLCFCSLCLFKEAGFIKTRPSVTLLLAGISIASPQCFPWHILKRLLHTDRTGSLLIDVAMLYKRPAALTDIFAERCALLSRVVPAVQSCYGCYSLGGLLQGFRHNNKLTSRVLVWVFWSVCVLNQNEAKQYLCSPPPTGASQVTLPSSYTASSYFHVHWVHSWCPCHKTNNMWTKMYDS